MICCLEMGKAEQEGSVFDWETFVVGQGWLNGEQLGALRSSLQGVAQTTLQTLDELCDIDVLRTIHQTMESVDLPDSFAQQATYDWARSEPAVSLAEGATLGIEAFVEPGRAPLSQVNIPTWEESLKRAEGHQERYVLGKELGRGGLGVVVEAQDKRLGRKVARKSLHEGKAATPQMLESFIHEACVTGQLEHPNIIPVYDIERDQGGEVFYTMRLMPSDNLEQTIAKQELGLIQYVKLLQQVCMGLEYAHSRGVVHRDIKPANILLGEFGEVLILDWGVAKVLQHDKLHNQSSSQNTQKLRGTPAYMAPELIKQGLVSPAIDQYALGVILYEMLTGSLPFAAENLYTLLFQITSEAIIPPSQRKKGLSIPEEIEQICLKMLAKEPSERFQSCREVHDHLEDFLEGSRERERRKEAAAARVQEASHLSSAYHRCRADERNLHREWEEAKKQVQSWESIEKKRHIWERERLFRDTQERAVSLFGEAIRKYTQALEHEPGNTGARRGLADLYWSQFEEAEARHDDLAKLQFQDLVRYYDDGTYARLLEGTGSVTISSSPSEAAVSIARLVEEDRRLVPSTFEPIGVTPLQYELGMGSYLLKLEKEGRADTLFPVSLQRCQEKSHKVVLLPHDTIPEGFIHIPAGSFTFGGDELAMMGVPARSVFVDDFLIAQYPITFAEYLTFLNDIAKDNPDAAAEMVPRNLHEEIFVKKDEAGNYAPDRSTLFHGEIAKRYPAGDEWHLPVIGVSWLDAVRYCRWRSEKEGRTVTLPTEEQWEKAAKGADNRPFPWGHHFEANFCKMARSRVPDELQPEPVGVFSADCSPYGMCDVVGTVCEWMLTFPQETVNEMTSAPDEPIFVRGAGWIASNIDSLRIGTRISRAGGAPSYNYGFRIVLPLD